MALIDIRDGGLLAKCEKMGGSHRRTSIWERPRGAPCPFTPTTRASCASLQHVVAGTIVEIKFDGDGVYSQRHHPIFSCEIKNRCAIAASALVP